MNFLVADIGGTNSRFSLVDFVNKEYTLIESIEFASQEQSSFIDLLEKLFKAMPTFHYKNIAKCVFAVTGVQNGKHLKNTNLPWVIDINEVHNHFSNFPEIILVNDFAAQAMACISPISQNFTPIFHQEQYHISSTTFPLVVMGAGTGLGSACLVKNTEDFILLPSEGGHQVFPFLLNNDIEKYFYSYLLKKKKATYPTIDMVLSGSGLAQLNTFLTSVHTPPKEIPNSAQAFEIFSIFFARALRNYALTVMAKTIVISGGIIAKHAHILNESFYKEFTNSTKFSQELSEMKLYLNTNEHAALYGATTFL